MKVKVLNLTCKTRDEVLDAISKDALKNKFASKAKPLFEAFKAREKTGTTGFEDGIAIPNARITENKETVVRSEGRRVGKGGAGKGGYMGARER